MGDDTSLLYNISPAGIDRTEEYKDSSVNKLELYFL